MLHIKFDQDWPTILWDIHVWKCKHMRKFLVLKGMLLQSVWLDLAEIRTSPRFYVCPSYLQVWQRSDQ